MYRYRIVCSILLLFGFMTVFAENVDVKISPYGDAAFEFGQMRGPGTGNGNTVKRWRQKASMDFKLKAVIDQRLSIYLHGGTYDYMDPQDNTPKTTPFFKIKNAYGMLPFGDFDRPFAEIAGGIFEFKYNPYSINLGEYLFKSGICQPWVLSDFEDTKARLQGLRVGGTLGNEFRLRYDVLFTSEILAPPLYDWIFGCVLKGFFFKDAFSIGTGVKRSSLIHVGNRYEGSYPKQIVLPDTVYNIDINYTFEDWFMMGMFTLDFMRLFGDEPNAFLNPKLFGEFNILGLTNQGVYDYIWYRVPVVVGFSTPVWKIFDVLSIELENFETPFGTKFDKKDTPVQGEIKPIQRKDNFYWVVYLQKTIVKGFGISAMLGRDHLRDEDGGWVLTEERMGQENVRFHVKLKYSIPCTF